MKKLLLTFVLCELLIVGCGKSASDYKNIAPSKADTSRILTYGNNVYYFPVIGADFGNIFSSFVGKRPELELVSIASDGTGPYGSDIGYFVVFKKK